MSWPRDYFNVLPSGRGFGGARGNGCEWDFQFGCDDHIGTLPLRAMASMDTFMFSRYHLAFLLMLGEQLFLDNQIVRRLQCKGVKVRYMF